VMGTSSSFVVSRDGVVTDEVGTLSPSVAIEDWTLSQSATLVILWKFLSIVAVSSATIMLNV
jgi:hypothetical protein